LSTPAVKLSQRHDVTLAVPPPRFNLPVPLARPTSKARVTLRGSHSFRGFFSARCLGSPGLDFQRALGILRSDCNPWRPFPKTLVYRAALPPAPHPELPMMRLPKKSDPSLSGPRYRHLPSVRHRHFLRDETLYPCGSGLGCGPCPAWGTDSLPRFGLQGDPVHVFHDSYIGSSGPFAPSHAADDILAKIVSRLRWGLHSSPLCTDVTGTVPVLSVLAAGAFRCGATALSFATVRWRGD
jgi:hypothetical protein